MGTFTPNIGLFIPAAGETNYNDAFAQGMINLDQHDHTGGPNKGLPITSSGLADFSVTFNKLNSNVVDPTTGIGVNSTPGSQNQLQILGILRNLFTLASLPGVGFISMNGSVVAGRTFQDTASLTWTNPDGVAGNPSAVVNIAGISPVTVPNGGTGLTSTIPFSLFAGGTTNVANLQQVANVGTLNQYLASGGPGVLPTWQNLPVAPTQNLQIATVTLSAAQFNALSGSPFTLVASPGAGKVIVPISCYGKLNYGGVDNFHSGSSVRLYYGGATNEIGQVFKTGGFTDSYNAYYYADNTQASSSTGVPIATWQNKAITISVNSSNFTGGAGNTVSFQFQYVILTI
jgi:hypothetical protein